MVKSLRIQAVRATFLGLPAAQSLLWLEEEPGQEQYGTETTCGGIYVYT